MLANALDELARRITAKGPLARHADRPTFERNLRHRVPSGEAARADLPPMKTSIEISPPGILPPAALPRASFSREGMAGPSDETPVALPMIGRPPPGPSSDNDGSFSIGRLDRARVRSVLAVLSGKGGVGKTFVAALLASEFHRAGARVGVLDADITGPSMARVFGVSGVPHLTADGQKIEPMRSSGGVFVMSMASVTATTKVPLLWRGPMINGAIRGLFKDTDWPELDYLIVDLPPGTSDAPMTVFQSLEPDGVVIVTAPTELSAEVVAKATGMAKTFSAPILGLVENMAYLTCPHGERVDLFGPSRGPDFATRMGIPYLGSIPIVPGLPGLADDGRIEELRSPEASLVAERVRLLLDRLRGAREKVARPRTTPAGKRGEGE
jgi:Mrp family chromosome partitioning ATPase